MSEDQYFETSEKYKSGFVLNEYKDEFSLIAAKEGSDGRIFQTWGEIEVKYDTKKRLPVSVRLGSRDDAIATLQEVLEALEGTQNAQWNDPPAFSAAEDDVPF